MTNFNNSSVSGSVRQRWSPGPENEDLRSAASSALSDIAHAIPLPGATQSEGSVAGGDAGHAVFYAYLACSGLLDEDAGDYRELALNHMQAAVDAIAALMAQPGLYGGFTGIGWSVNHLHALGILEDDELCAYIDEALVVWLNREPEVLGCELIWGLAGMGLYGVARQHRAAGREILRLAVKALESSAIEHRGHRTWVTSPRHYHYPKSKSHLAEYYDLGVSHGVPGAINFLAQAAALDIPGAATLATDAGAWLFLQRRKYRNGSQFGHLFVSDPMEETGGSRTSWCYGDLGISAALLLSARCLKRTDWEPQALEIARAVALRRSQGSKAKDAALCHGAIGNAHIFNRLHAATGELCFLEAAHFWLREGLNTRKPGMGLAGFSAWQPVPDEPEGGHWQPLSGFLEGVSGIGLALLGFLAPIEPAWDQLLMVNIPAKVA